MITFAFLVFYLPEPVNNPMDGKSSLEQNKNEVRKGCGVLNYLRETYRDNRIFSLLST